ncbi:hypothetical protein MA16_Dca006268 [Dendrobium catenatum]|uniref:Uncharacterized protein n=1 Tax=Dendrobium catenatum TaxID=906689 RepID=A0A2I0W9E4_9ASPA|nr:hypothetical protein MA16_Dca006268 [Dendrobium catenatum]
MVKRARVSVAAKEKERKVGKLTASFFSFSDVQRLLCSHPLLTCAESGAGDGILKLHGDIQTCEYQDILVMWDMLQNTNTEDKAAVTVTSSQH